MFLTVEGHWAPWSSWSQCPESCLEADQLRVRNVSWIIYLQSFIENFSVWRIHAIKLKTRRGLVLVVLGLTGQIGQSVLTAVNIDRNDPEHNIVRSRFKQVGIKCP